MQTTVRKTLRASYGIFILVLHIKMHKSGANCKTMKGNQIIVLTAKQD